MNSPIGKSRSDNKRIATRVRQLLNRRGWSAAYMARLVGTGEDQFRKYLRMDRGYRQWPFWLIWSVAAYLDVEIEEIIYPQRPRDNSGTWLAAHDEPSELTRIVTQAEEQAQSKRSHFTLLPCAYRTEAVANSVHHSRFESYNSHPHGQIIRNRFHDIAEKRRAAFLKNGISYQVRSFIFRSDFNRLLNQSYPYDGCTPQVIRDQLQYLRDECVRERGAPLVILNDRKIPIDLVVRLRNADSSMLFGTNLVVRREHNLVVNWSRQSKTIQRTCGLLDRLERYAVHHPSKKGLSAWLDKHLLRIEGMLEKSS